MSGQSDEMSRREVARIMPFLATNLWFVKAELDGSFPPRVRRGGRSIYSRKAVEAWIADYLAKAAAAEAQGSK